MACKVFVGSLPMGTKPKELRHLFQSFGIVIECDVKNRCGFIHMETPAMAETAILALNGSEFKGQMINVEPGRSKDVPQNIGQGPPNNMICNVGEQGGPGLNAMNAPNFQGRGNPGFRRGGGPPMMGGAFNNQGGMPNRGGGPPNRSGVGGNPFNYNRGGMQDRGGAMFGGPNRGDGGMGGRGGPDIGNRGGFNNRNQPDGGPMRNAPNFKQRSGPYPPINNGGPPNEGGVPARGGKFGGNQRSGFNGPQNRNQNTQQRNNNWGNQNNAGGPPQHGGNFENINAMGSGFGGNMRNPNIGNNFGQDRRGFTLDDSQPLHGPPPQQQQYFGGNRGPKERNNFQAPDGETAAFGNPHGFDGPRRGGGGGSGNFAPGRGNRGGGGRGGGRGPGNFGPPPEQSSNYNQEFPALQPTRGRGGFGGGNRGGFNRNAPNMMPNRRQNM